MALTNEDKQWIAGELNGFKGEISQQINEHEQEISRQMNDHKGEIFQKLDDLQQYVDQRTYDAGTRLLRAFADYNVASDVRFRKLEADTSNTDTSATKRMGELERRVTDMDVRIIRLEGHPPAQQ